MTRSRFHLLNTFQRGLSGVWVYGLLWWCLALGTGWAQNQFPIIQKTAWPDNLVLTDESVCFAQDSLGFVYVGTGYGVVRFGGRQPQLLTTPSTVRCILAGSPLEPLTVALDREVGVLEPTLDGSLRYRRVAAVSGGEEVRDGLRAADGQVLVLTDRKLYTLAENKLQAVAQLPEGQTGNRIVQAGAKRIVLTDEGGAWAVEGTACVAVPGVSLAAGLLFAAPAPEGKYLLGLANGDLVTLDGQQATVSFENLRNKQFFQAAVHRSFAAFATSNQGVLLTGADGKVKSVLNPAHGTPESEVLGVFIDRNGLLFIAHPGYLSWLEPMLPLNRYEDPALGTVNDVAVFKGKPYLATDAGLFCLTEIRATGLLDENKVLGVLATAETRQRAALNQVTTEKQKIQQEAARAKEQATAQARERLQEASEVDAPKKGFLKSKKKKEAEKAAAEAEARARVEAVSAEEKARLAALEARNQAAIRQQEAVRQEALRQAAQIEALKRSLAESRRMQQQNTRSDFQRLMGAPQGKFNDLIIHDGRLLAAGQTGLYEVEDLQATSLGGIATRQLYADAKNTLWALPMGKGIGTYDETAAGFSFVRRPGVTAQVTTVVEDEKNNLWLGTDQGLLQLTADSALQVSLAGASTLPTRVFRLGNRLVASTAQQTYRQAEDGSFTPAPSLHRLLAPEHRPRTFVQAGQSWVLSANRLYRLEASSGDLAVVDSILALGAQDRVRAVFVEGTTLWAASASRLLELHLNDVPADVHRRKLTLRLDELRVNGQLTEILPTGLDLPSAAQYALSLKFSAACFEQVEGLKYEYRLGTEAAWQPLPSGNLNLTLPYGSYELAIRCIDGFGNSSAPVVYPIEIATPLWARVWFWVLVVLALIGGVTAFFWQRQKALERRKKELEDEVARQTVEIRAQRDEIKREKDISEGLLLNILPKPVADELKQDGKALARHYDAVSVLFTDFKGFTMAAEKMSPVELTRELDYCFATFDSIVDKYGLEKIKTIGDAYMCASGIPVEAESHALRVVMAGLEFQAFMQAERRQREAQNRISWDLRLGIHSGPLVAGVIGKKKFAYDIWGDTVNTASRMESSGEVGHVNISGDTYRLIEPYFECTHRGQVPAKNKGHIDMYFVDRLKPEYAADAQGQVPNARFMALLSLPSPAPVTA
jgi:class 3 adenylate cyclase